MDHTYHACLLTRPILGHFGTRAGYGPRAHGLSAKIPNAPAARAHTQGPTGDLARKQTKKGIKNLVIVAPFQEVNALQGHMAQGPTGPNEQIARHGVGSIGGRVTESPPLATPWG